MAPRVPPLDEIEWEDPHVIPGLGFGPELNTQNILWYFTNSPFFDAGSNNMSLLGHAQNAPDRDRIFGNRLAFEEALRDRYPTGFQFVVMSEPKAEGEPWVIQRQQKTRDGVSGEIVTEVQGTYFTVGNKIFMAPSLLDIVRSRMLSIATLGQEIFDMGQEGVHWSPAAGHTYFPPSYETTKAAGSAAGSRAGSVVPGGVDMDTSQASVTQPAEEQITEFSDAFFLQSLQLTNQYGNEFMDENPLQGEPGSFVFASTKQQVEARNKAAAAASQAALAAPAKPDDSQSVVSSSVAPTPKPLPTEASSRKGSIASIPPKVKKERRKSKGLASPISPTGPS